MRDLVERVRAAFGLVFASRGYRLLAGGLFVAFLTLYLFLLPGAYTGGIIGWVSLRFLTPTLVFFSLLLAALVSLSLTFSVYGFRTAAAARGHGASLLSVVTSIMPGLLCCTPVVPTVLALLGASTPTIFGLSGRIQGIFATYEVHFLAAAALLLVYALHRNIGQLFRACPRELAGRTA